MDGKTFRALVEAGAIRKVRIIGEGCNFRVEAVTQAGTNIIYTSTGKLKQWRTLDAAAKWVHSFGIGTLQVNLEQWQPKQRVMNLT